jgi:hypothetical protein
MAGFLPPAIFEIKAIADQAIAKFGEVNKELEKMEGQAEKAGGSVSKMEKTSRVATAALIGMGTAFAAFAAIGVKGVIEDEKAFTQLGQTLSNLGINIKANRDLVGELDGAYSKLGFGGDETATALNRLLSTTNDLDKSQALLATSANLARAKNIDLASAASILGKASMGNAKAFKEMGITLDETLPKNEAIAKAFDELNDKIGGQAVAYTKTFSGQLVVLKEQISNVADTIGAVILPYLKSMVDTLQKAIVFVQRNAQAFKIFAGVVVTITAALAAYNIGVKVSIALTKAWTVVTKAQKIATLLLTGQFKALNTVMKANPIGLIFTAATLLIGAFVMLWNKSETFRKAVISVGKAGLMAFASIIPIIGKVGEAILKILFAPLKALLSALSKLPGVGKFAKAGLDILNKGLDGVSDLADGASKKAKELAANLDKLNKPIKIGGGKGIEVPDFGNTEGGVKSGKSGKTAAQKKTEAEQKKYLTIVGELQDKVKDATKQFNEEMVEIDKDYNKKVTNLNSEALERKNELIADANEKIKKLEKSAGKARLEEETKKNQKIAEAQRKFTSTITDITRKRDNDLARLELEKQQNIAKITEEGNAKLQEIVQDSINRLREAYKSGTRFNVGDLFTGLKDAGEQSANGLLTKLKERLFGARKLAENAGKLSSAGFTQTFIEQIVSQGSDVGNQLAESLLSAEPAIINALQETYIALEDISDTGLDALAKSLNSSTSFATAQLAEAYEAAKKDIAKSLAEVNRDYVNGQSVINQEFEASMREAENIRDAAIAESLADFNAAISQINSQLAEAVTEVTEELNKALAEEDKNLNKSLAEAAADMADAQDKAKKKLADTLEDIKKEYEKKLGEMEIKIASLIAKIAELQGAIAAASTLTIPSIPIPSVPIVPTPSSSRAVPADGSVASWRAGEQRTMSAFNITQNFTATKVDSYDVHSKTIAAIKLGSTVTVPSRTVMSQGSLRSRGID